MAKPGERYRLTPAAIADLEAIWSWTARNWSVEQADAYVTGLERTFALLAANPRIARERNEITPPVRIFRHRAHIVVYRVEGSRVVVPRVRHAREDWSDDPAEGARGRVRSRWTPRRSPAVGNSPQQQEDLRVAAEDVEREDPARGGHHLLELRK